MSTEQGGAGSSARDDSRDIELGKICHVNPTSVSQSQEETASCEPRPQGLQYKPGQLFLGSQQETADSAPATASSLLSL